MVGVSRSKNELDSPVFHSNSLTVFGHWIAGFDICIVVFLWRNPFACRRMLD